MAANRGVVYVGPGKVEVQSIDYPKLQTPAGRKIEHGVVLKCVTTNICGSDQHMVRGRTTAPTGLVLGHEITGEVVECGRDVEFIKKGARRTNGWEGRGPKRAVRPRAAEYWQIAH